MKKIVLLVLLLVLLAGCQSSHSLQDTYSSPPTYTSETTHACTSESTTETTLPLNTTEPVVRDPLETLIETMSIEERVGQLFLVAMPAENPIDAIQSLSFGGIILFGSDFEGQTPESFSATIKSCQEAASIPMFIAVDEEGGSVCRVSGNTAFREQRFQSPRQLYSQNGIEALLQTEQKKCTLLSSIGVNVNLAPVCDIATEPGAFMYSRSLGQSPEITASVIHALVKCMQENHIGSTLKHFPGYGNNTDTHVAMATDSRSIDELETHDLQPFYAGISAGCGAVMISHTIVTALDEELPASLSFDVHRYLREQMDFEGVCMTDDLNMGAIMEYYDAGEAAVLAVLAGNDLLCSLKYEEQYAAVLSAVLDGRISVSQLNASVMRVLRWKQNLGLLNDILPD